MKIKPQSPRSPVPIPKQPDLDFERMHIAFCFRDIDPNQGGTLKNWEDLGLLPRMVYRIADVSRQTIREAKQNQSVKTYHTFPIKSDFKHPAHVTEDAEWAAIHIMGKRVLGGHIERNIFHVVFLDSDHRFAISSKLHT